MEAKAAVDWIVGVVGILLVPGFVWAAVILGLIFIVRDKLRTEYRTGGRRDPGRVCRLISYQFDEAQSEIELARSDNRAVTRKAQPEPWPFEQVRRAEPDRHTK